MLPHEIIFESQTGNPRTLSMQILSWKLSRTNQYTSTQNRFRGSSGQSPYSLHTNLLLEVKPDKPISFHNQLIFENQAGQTCIFSHELSFGSQAGHTGTLPSKIYFFESHAGRTGTLS